MAILVGYPAVGIGVGPGNHLLHLEAAGPDRGTGGRGSLDADNNGEVHPVLSISRGQTS